MCTGMELLLGLGALGGAAASLFAPEPELDTAAADIPATDPGVARDSGATVRVGTNDAIEDEDPAAETGTEFVEERKQAQTITGLGKGGLAL